MTLKEIAQETGLSVSTVSRIINKENYKCTSREAEARVWEIVRNSGYTPNLMAKELKKNGSKRPMSRNISCLFARTENSVAEQFFFSDSTGGRTGSPCSGLSPRLFFFHAAYFRNTE